MTSVTDQKTVNFPGNFIIFSPKWPKSGQFNPVDRQKIGSQGLYDPPLISKIKISIIFLGSQTPQGYNMIPEFWLGQTMIDQSTN